jgi:uncharacterized membrane protein YfcA
LVNVLAAGGSLISMPVLILLGLPPAAANGTNRVAILIQNITAVGTFRQRGFAEFTLSLRLAACTIPGALLGAVAAIEIDPELFKRMLAGVLIGSLILMFGGRRKERAEGAEARMAWAFLASAAAGFWGGFMQAGVGFLIMPILHRLLALDLVRVNMHKVFIIGAYNVPVLAVFAMRGHVWWTAGLVLALGNAVGAWLGTRLTISHGEPVVRVVFALAVVAMAVRLVVG